MDGLTLAGDFPEATRDQWLALVDKVLKGADPGKRLVRRTADRIPVAPLYTAADAPGADAGGFPGGFPYLRGSTAAGRVQGGWDVRQRHAHPDPAAANVRIREDLGRGVTSVMLRIDTAMSMQGEEPDGCCVIDIDDLDAALAGVDLATTPVALDGGRFGANAALLVALCRRRGVDPATAPLALNVDPVGIAARGLGIDTERGLRRAGEVAAYADRHLGRATALLSDGHVYHAGGGSEAQELAATMATAVAYLRAAEAAGLPPERAARQIAFRLAVDADVFLSIAKLRAARLLWARICEVSGASAHGMQLHAMTASRMLTRRDPFNNLLRTTLATYAAAMGGADAVTVLPFDYALGLPDPLARRLARNVQLVLMEESQLHRVIDPMGGAWLIEDLTRRLATEAWSLFQAIEGGGGIVEMLMKGTVQDWIAATVAERNDAIARRREPITGVSEFPNLAEQPWQPEGCDTGPLVARFREKAQHARDTRGLPFPDMIDACGRGETVLYRGSLASYTGIPPRRLAEPFEALRDRSDAVLAATGQRPRLFLACLGTPAQYGARLTFAQNLLAAGGIEAVPSEPLATGEAAGPAWSAAATPVAALCGGDETYGACGVAAIEALLAAGCRRVWVFGKPPAEAALAMAGADGFVRAGDDVLQVLERMHDILGEAP